MQVYSEATPLQSIGLAQKENMDRTAEYMHLLLGAKHNPIQVYSETHPIILSGALIPMKVCI